MTSFPKSKKSALKKHIVFINYYFPPMGGGGVQRITKFLKYFDYENHRVSVLSVKPSFFYTNDFSLLSEIPSGIQVIRTGSLDPFRIIFLLRKFFQRKAAPDSSRNTFHNESGGKIRKIAMSIFVPDSRLLWLPFAMARMIRLNRGAPFDVIVASMPPFTAGLIAILCRHFIKAPVILDFRDAWTNNPYLPGIGKLQQTLSSKMEAYCLKRAAAYIFVNPALRGYYEKKYPEILQKPVTVIRNGFDPADFESISSEGSTKPESSLNLGIMGTIYSQGNTPATLLKAIDQLNRENAGFKHKFRLTFLGKWSSDFLDLIKAENVEELVEFIPYLPHREALARAREFDALVLSIDSRLAGSAEVTPGRIYEYLYLKKPILALCPPQSDLGNLVRDSDAGEVVEYANIPKIKAVLQNWVNNKSSFSGRYRFSDVDQYSRIRQTYCLLEFIDKVSKQQNPQP